MCGKCQEKFFTFSSILLAHPLLMHIILSLASDGPDKSPFSKLCFDIEPLTFSIRFRWHVSRPSLHVYIIFQRVPSLSSNLRMRSGFLLICAPFEEFYCLAVQVPRDRLGK